MQNQIEELNKKLDLILEKFNKNESGILNQNEATAYMNFKDIKTFKKWAEKNEVPFARQGRLKIYQKKDLEWALDRVKKSR